MISKLHVISGLPRSGSTLLSALLRQNPRFSASVTSPVMSLCEPVLKKMSGSSEFVSFFDDERREAILRSVINGYYHDAAPGQVIFDTNRTWTTRAALLGKLYPDARIICCVRDIAWIIDSVERLLRKNPLQLSKVFGFQSGGSVYSRSEALMDTAKGLVGHPWVSLREAWFSDSASRLIIVPFDRLTGDPEGTLLRLYDELGEPAFQHDFQNVSFDAPDYDATLGMPGLHRVKSRVVPDDRQPSIPPDLFAKYQDSNFWERREYLARGVKML